MENMPLGDVPAMLASGQVDVGVGKFAVTSSRQLHLDFISVAFSVK
jgi:hypothetical protein